MFVPPATPAGACGGGPAGLSVATFTDADPTATAANFSATIDWGDNSGLTTVSGSQISGSGAAGFSVHASHVYAEEGSYTPTVAISNASGATVSAKSVATVTDAPLSRTSASIAVGTTVSGTVATFSDPDQSDTTSDYFASIDWGDGQRDTGTVVRSAIAGQFGVAGNHSYSDGSSQTITVTVTHGGDQPLIVKSAEPGQQINAQGNFGLVEDIYVVSSGTVTVPLDNGVLRNDTAPSALTVAASTATGLNGGTFVFNADGSFTYTPPAQFPGFDYAKYTATDAQGDKASATVTVLSQQGGVIWKFYEQVLNRAPDYTSLGGWIKDLQKTGQPGDIAAGFFESTELLNQIITGYYEQYLGREPQGNDLTGWEAVWRQTGGPEQIKAGFADSAEFYNTNGATPATWLTALYEKILDRMPDQAGYNGWLQYYQQQLAAGVDPSTSRYQIAIAFFTSPEAYKNDVTAWWYEYFGQAPSLTEQAQYANQMSAGASDKDIEQEITNRSDYADDPPAQAAGTAVRLSDYYPQTSSARSQASIAASDAVFAGLG